jgi:hypothetical protein
MIGFISASVTLSVLATLKYSAIADLHHLEFTVAHAIGFSVSPRRLLAADLNIETSASNYYEVHSSYCSVTQQRTVYQECIFTGTYLPTRCLAMGVRVTVHENAIGTSQETHYFSATETNRLMLFRETVAVYCESHTEHINTLCGQNAETLYIRIQFVPHRKHITSLL